MKHKLFYFTAMALISASATVQAMNVSIYSDCSKNGYIKEIKAAEVQSSSGRTWCEYVQLWENGPKWATFNVGATITDYANLTAGTDATSGNVAYYNTANVGGLYPWNNPNLNGRKTTWTSSVSTGISDVATTLWGSNWQTPTYAQLDSLQNSTYTTWTWCNGSTTQYVKGCPLKGYKVSGVGDYAQYSIFLPVAGYFDCGDGKVHDARFDGFYWSSTEYDSDYAYFLYFGSDDRYMYYFSRENGRSVRAVLADNAVSSNKKTTNATTANQVVLTLYANGCEAANVIKCPNGYSVRVTAEPDYGYHFAQWSDGNTTNPRTLQVTTNTTLTATFAKNAYTITTSVNYPERGSTTGDTTVLYQDNVTISAVANYGYHFTRWNDGNTDNPRTVEVTEDKTYQAIFELNRYQLTASTNGHGYVYGGGTYNYLSNVNMSVNADFGYHFVQWNDGNKDNPRSLTITQDTAFTAIIAKTYFGLCGDNLYWTYANQTLTITGTGAMYNYTTAPWGLFLDSIKTISLPAGCTSLGNNCFKDIAGLNAITIPASVTTIGANAFAGCRKLYDIYCYAAEPPVAQTSSFENYNVYLYAPCDNKRDYEMDAVFGSFKYIQCIGAEPIVTPTTTVTIEPTETTAAITWPTENQASTYTIEITKEGVVFCTLIFDADGRLTSIAFAPGRGANMEVVAATATSAGFSFTVTGLQSGTHYNYEIDVQNSAAQSIKTHTGAFDTKSVTAVENVNDNHNHNRKVIRDGILLIERNGVYYNAQGAIVE